MKPKLSPEKQKQEIQRKSLNVLCNRILSAHSFKQIKTWSDLFKYVSKPEDFHDADPAEDISYQDLKSFLQSLKDKQESQFASVKKEEVIVEKPIPAPPVFRIKLPEVQEPLPEPPPPSPDDKPSSDNDYLLPYCKHEAKNMIKFWYQRKAVKDCLDLILIDKAKAIQIIAAAGYGKTFIAGGIACRLKDLKYADDKTFGATKYLYVTKNTVVEQTRRVFETMFGLTMYDGFEVINYEMLRSKAGSLWVKEKASVVDGEEVIQWEWRKMLNPVVIFWDENQSLKNSISLQHQIASAFNDIKTPIVQIFISATPYTRVCEAKCFAVATHKDITEHFGMPTKLTNETWPTYAKIMCLNSSPEDYNEAAVERLTKDLDKYIVRVRGVRPQFHAINRVKMIRFETREEQQYYDDTEERYLREKAKLEKAKEEGEKGTGLLHLVLLTKRAVAAEYCRRYHFAKCMNDVRKSGKAAACAVKYKTTLIPIVKILVDEYGWKRDEISLVWGGGQTALTKKQKNKAKIREKAAALEAMGLSADEMMKDLDLEDVEDRVLEELPEELRLGAQSKLERQKEIDKFQAGKSIGCIYTFKAGGVGLSLHHTDELTTDWDRSVPGFDEWYAQIQRMRPENRPLPGKVRRQKNGFAVEEDIKFIFTKPRQTCLSVAYSEIDMVQSTGRVPRVTSLSDTEQDCILYAGTVEVDIAHVYSSKLKCLNKVVRTNESWIDLIVGGDRQRIVDEHLAHDKEFGDGNEDEDNMITGDTEDDE